MKKGKYVLILFLIFAILILVTALSFLYYGIGAPPAIPSDSYLELKLQGPLVEYAEPGFLASLLGGRPLSVYDIWMALRKAGVDRRITGVLLKLGPLGCDWAKCSELREDIRDFRKSGKKIYAYIEEAPDFNKEYYLATACDRIILHPLGWLGIRGIGGSVPFFKKALEKLGVEAEVEHVEEFKTAYNMFTESGFTEAHRTMMESILGDEFAVYVAGVAEARKLSEARVRQLIDEAFFQGEEALKAGLVDDILFEDQAVNLFQKAGRKNRRVTLGDYIGINPTSLGLNTGRRIALIYGQGMIFSGEGYFQTMGSETVARWIRAAREDPTIAAVVFRVDSPGGSAVASDSIWREVMLCRKEKPFIVSMSDVAGSGGYWISMAAHKIVAQPQTLTGSIGVISGKFNIKKLSEKLGINAEKVGYGKKVDIYSPFRSLTPDERQLFKKEILWIYDRFLSQAAEGRKMSKEDVDKIGKGRVWTGRQAKELNLVDEIGGLARAIDVAKDLAGIPKSQEVRLAIWPKKTGFFGSLFGLRQSGLGLMAPREIRSALEWAEGLEADKILAIMPFVLTPQNAK
jgi:protease-4